MLFVFPDYYKKFKCIKSECRHNCCIGWEIDIDPDTYSFYRSVGNIFDENISTDGEPHFILGENERCPFLNKDNLCDIIIGFGEKHLCHICREHPRFYNELYDRTEAGIGLCCEEAARIILDNPDTVKLETEGESEYEDKIITLRDGIIAVLQNRNKNITERIKDMLLLCGTTLPQFDLDKWCGIFLGLERLDGAWTVALNSLKAGFKTANLKEFDLYMKNRQTEYEQLLVYLIYRHLSSAFDKTDAKIYALFAALSFTVIYYIGAVSFTEKGSFTFTEQAETARLFSSEIEYSDQNLDIILQHLQD